MLWTAVFGHRGGLSRFEITFWQGSGWGGLAQRRRGAEGREGNREYRNGIRVDRSECAREGLTRRHEATKRRPVENCFV
jgi:hypothetical protein